jgi:hypothetical protein
MKKGKTKMTPVKQNDISDTEDDDIDNYDTECGIGPCRKIKFFRYFANKNVYIFVYGILGCVYGSTYAYSNSTISTIEKRFKIPSKITGKF